MLNIFKKGKIRTIDSMSCKEFVEYMDSENFENFKSNLCHLLKSEGDLPFLTSVLKKDIIRYCYKKKIYLECYYLLGLIDYLCRVNELPYDKKYNDIRKYGFTEPLFPEGIDFKCYILKDDTPKIEYLKNAIPEFLQYNIVEGNVRNVA